jgi:drug/metabolite transporter (DMT)-like permease
VDDLLDRFLDKKRNLYALAIAAIVFESLSSTVLKLGGLHPFLSPMYLFYFGLAMVIMAIYAVAWQLLLERLPLTTAYLRKGLTYTLIFVWAALFFQEVITLKQIIGMAVIIVGMVVSMSDER